MNTVEHFQRALKWVDKHSIPGSGIAVSSRSPHPYPEVSGYYITSLLAWNEKDRAISYGRWLVSTQHPDGSWGDPDDNRPYAFDTGQIVKGLLALAKETQSKEWEMPVRRACEWLTQTISESGEPFTPDKKAWQDGVPLGVLLYSFEAVKRAGIFFEEPVWIAKVEKSEKWFLQNPNLTDFTHLSHFHAYILEALCDLGHYDRAREGMKKVSALQNKNGAVPAFPDVKWVCSTGLFQYAIVWYKLGEQERGDLAFSYATQLQNKSGGWYGSYGWFAKYFPKAEIAWAVKYFLDALEWRLKLSFEKQACVFSDKVEDSDGRYQLIKGVIAESNPRDILDAGCGKGRYLRNILNDFTDLSLHASDLSTRVMSSLPHAIEKKQGSLLRLPYPDSKFDLVYTVEALEHAVHIDGALRELNRVLKPGGKLIIIDKNSNRLGTLNLPDWEQWFETKDLSHKLKLLGHSVLTRDNVPYEGKADGLFTAWIGTKTVSGVNA